MRLVFLAAVCSILPETICAQDAAEQTPMERWNDFYAGRVAQYEITPGDADTTEFQLRADPLLSYTNPVRGRDQHGGVFVWTRDGRPGLLGSIWSIRAPNNVTRRRTSHEVHSLARVPLHVACPALADPRATRAAALSWNLEPADESLLLSIDVASPPAESPARRMIQMRAIAGDLSAVSIDRNDGSERPLRLLRSPLMRYQSAGSGVIDGCVFAFALATDPELLVLVEAIQESEARGEKRTGSARWRIQGARFTGMEVRLHYQQEEIWRCEKIKYDDQTGPYRLRVGVSEL